MPREQSVEGVARRLNNRCPNPSCGGLLYESDDGELGCMRCEQVVYTPRKGRPVPVTFATLAEEQAHIRAMIPPGPDQQRALEQAYVGWYWRQRTGVDPAPPTPVPARVITLERCPRCSDPLSGSRLACYACGWERPLDIPRSA